MVVVVTFSSTLANAPAKVAIVRIDSTPPMSISDVMIDGLMVRVSLQDTLDGRDFLIKK